MNNTEDIRQNSPGFEKLEDRATSKVYTSVEALPPCPVLDHEKSNSLANTQKNNQEKLISESRKRLFSLKNNKHKSSKNQRTSGQASDIIKSSSPSTSVSRSTMDIANELWQQRKETLLKSSS